MLSFLGFGSKKNTKVNTESEKNVLNRMVKEKRQRSANRAYQEAVYQYHTMPEPLKAANVNYARRKGILNKYQVGKYPSLPLAKYKEFEEELKVLRLANKEEEAERRRRENAANVAEIERLREEAEQYRRGTAASDPRAPSPPFGGRRTRKQRRRRRTTRKR